MHKIDTLKWAIIISGVYLLVLSGALISTDNKFIGFFGEYQRRNGFLSYASLIILFLTACFLFRINNINRLERCGAYTGFAVGIYGILQHFKHDFISWTNPYNSILSTLGNPDFVAAVLAIFTIISFGIFIQKQNGTLLRIFAGLNTGFLFLVILYSQVRQGLITSIVGIFLIYVIYIHQRKKIAAYFMGFTGLIIGLFAILGMLNIGPLQKFFYKISVTYRGDYWRAGWNMFIHHPWFGVGLDRYGANFRLYRDATQAARRGPDLVSNAAHNVPLQLASTGGIFVFLAFLFFTGFIFYRGVLALKNTSGHQQITVAVVFSAWLAYEAQSLISIDNLAIAIWGYMLGGAVVGISVISEHQNPTRSRFPGAQPIVSIMFMLIPAIVSILFLQSEVAMQKNLRTKIPSVPKEQWVQYENYIKKPLTFGVQEPLFQSVVATGYANLGDFDSALKLLNKVVENDPLNFISQENIAEIYEFKKDWKNAIAFRWNLYQLDRYNEKNLLQLGKDEKNDGNLSQAKNVIPLIKSFAPSSPELQQALETFGK